MKFSVKSSQLIASCIATPIEVKDKEVVIRYDLMIDGELYDSKCTCWYIDRWKFGHIVLPQDVFGLVGLKAAITDNHLHYAICSGFISDVVWTCINGKSVTFELWQSAVMK